MSRDIRGAVASNAGDEFHELWALREALKLVQIRTDLHAITLEGVAVSGPVVAGGREWDGVDCALYYGGTSIASAERIDLVQLKYSSSENLPAWTVANLTASTSVKDDNSVIRKLARAFTNSTKGRSAKYIWENVRVSLVSNRPIGKKLNDAVTLASTGGTSTDIDNLAKASGLSKSAFANFCSILQLQGGADASPRLRTDAVKAIAAIRDADVKQSLLDLRMHIRTMMLPAGARQPIVRDTVLGWLDTGLIDSLYPCPADFEPLGPIIERPVAEVLAQAIAANPLVCLVGAGGCGKTTTLRTFQNHLPPGSETIVFDSYGGGRYADASVPRHRPLEVFTQLNNEIAERFQLPIFIPLKDHPNIVSVRFFSCKAARTRHPG
jgi:hypothetical protein